jgi:hypothetical protein
MRPKEKIFDRIDRMNRIKKIFLKLLGVID